MQWARIDRIPRLVDMALPHLLSSNQMIALKIATHQYDNSKYQSEYVHWVNLLNFH